MGNEQQWAAAAQQTLDGMLRTGERAVAAAAGTDPRSVTTDKALGATESVVRGLGTSQAKAQQRAQQLAGTGERLLAVTTQRLFQFDRGELTDTVDLSMVENVEVKRALANAYRHVITVRCTGGKSIALEGDKAQVDELAQQIARRSPVGAGGLKQESSTWVLRMAPVVVLLLFGGLFVLMGVAVSFDEGVGTGAIPVLIGGVMVAGGIGLRKVLLK